MKRGTRVALEILGPPFLGTLLPFGFWAVVQGWSGQFLSFQFHDLAVTFFWAYLFGGPPSVGYMAVMESRFARGLDPRSWRAVGLSTLLGLAAGGVITCLISLSTFSGPDFETLLGIVGSGVAVGFVLGLLIKRFSRPAVGR